MAGWRRVLLLALVAATVLSAVNSQHDEKKEASKYEKYYKTYRQMTSPDKLPAVPPPRSLYRPHRYNYRRHYPRATYRHRTLSYPPRYRSLPRQKPYKGNGISSGKKYIIDDNPSSSAVKSFSSGRRASKGISSSSKNALRSRSSAAADQTKIMRYSKPKNNKPVRSKTSATNKGRKYLKNLLTKYELPELENSTHTPTYRYVCPPEFLKLGNGCYYVSKALGSWQWAHFECRERGSQLAALGSQWEDSVLRGYLNRPTITPLNRWIGGIHDWQRGRWQWGGSGAAMAYQGFLSVGEGAAVSPQWSCAYMNPELYYRWSYAKCTEKMHFICEAPFKKVKN